MIFGIKQASVRVDSWVYSMWECDLLDLESTAVSDGSAAKQPDIFGGSGLPQNSLGQSTV